MSESSEQQKNPQLLTEEEIEKYISMDYQEKNRLNIYGEEETKFVNTIKALEEDLGRTEGIHRFIQEGVLVNDQIILCAKPDTNFTSRRGMQMRVLGQIHGSITVELTIEDANRLLKMLPAMIEASKKVVQLNQLRELWKEKKRSSSRRW